MWFRKRTSSEGQRKEREYRDIATEQKTDSEDHSPKRVFSEEDNVEDSDVDIDMLEDVGSEDNDDDDYSGKADADDIEFGDLVTPDADRKKKKQTSHLAEHFGVRWSLRLAGGTDQPVENRDLGTKNILRQRPTRNSALDSIVIPDSDDENRTENATSEVI